MIRCDAAQCHSVQCCGTVYCSAVLRYSPMWCSVAVQRCGVQCSGVWCSNGVFFLVFCCVLQFIAVRCHAVCFKYIFV
jgi:hypothetical protein